MAKSRSSSRRAATLSPALRLETLEQRQLLATIVAGSGTEVASNVQLPQGTYDQILLTGASVTVAADPGQVVRVSFLDQGGDIVQAEFAGHGTMTISLENFKSGTATVNKNPDQFLNGQKIQYVQGLASVTIDNPQVDTNFGMYSAGPIVNPGFYAGQTRLGDNNIADIARLILNGDSTNGAGYSNFGGIRAGNTVFSAESGLVGIQAPLVAVQDIVAIGDIDARGTAIPSLRFNPNSQFQTVFVRGGDFYQSNGASFESTTYGGLSFLNSTDGTTSGGTLLPASPLYRSAFAKLGLSGFDVTMAGDWTFDWTNPQAVVVTKGGSDVSSLYGGDWLAKGGLQAGLNYAFDQRFYSGNVVIKGDLASNLTLSLSGVGGNLTFENNLDGNLVINGVGTTFDGSTGLLSPFARVGGTLTVKGNLDGDVTVRGGYSVLGLTFKNDNFLNRLNELVVEGSVGASADIRAEEIGNVTLRQNFSGILSTDVTRNQTWNGTPLLPTPAAGTLAFTDYEGKIGNVTIGYTAAGASTGGSILNGTIQGMAGIGNIKVGGDVAGASPLPLANRAIFTTSSNPGAAPNDVVNLGFAPIGTIEILGDVDLDGEADRLIYIAGAGNFGDITVQGKTTTGSLPGLPISSVVQVVPGTETLLRLLSPFTDKNFAPDVANGQRVVANFDPDGVTGSLDNLYRVVNNDVVNKAQVYDFATGKLVTAKIGDLVPQLENGVPVLDAAGFPVYVKNTGLFQASTRTVPILGPSVTGFVSGNRGTLDGQYNHFGRIEIANNVSSGFAFTTGKINWTDSVDMNFGGLLIGAAATGVAPAGSPTIGQITVTSSAGATSDILFSGPIGTKNTASLTTAQATLTGLSVNNFEDVRFAAITSDPASNQGFHLAGLTNGIVINTVAGSGTGQKAVSPSVVFDSRLHLDSGLEKAPETPLLNINTGMVNSSIVFNAGSGIVANAVGGSGGAVGNIGLSADTVTFDGILQGPSFGSLTLTGGKGASSASGAAVSFTGTLAVGALASVTASSQEGNVVFAPAVITGPLGKASATRATIGPVSLSTAGTNNGGDVVFGSGAFGSSAYQANFGDITLTAGHKLSLSGGVITENPGLITLSFETTGKIGNLSATSTTGQIQSTFTVQGDAGNVVLRAGAATTNNTETYSGLATDLVRAGSIVANQTIWGTRGLTRLETAGQATDGSAATLQFLTAGNKSNQVLPEGTITAKISNAGASLLSDDSFIVRSGAGAVSIGYNILGIDDNGDGKIALSEIGHGGQVAVSSISGDITFAAGTQLNDGTTASVLGNVSLKTGAFANAAGLIGAAQKGDITLSFNDLPEAPATGGFEGQVGNLTLTTTAGNILWEASRFDGAVGDVSLKTGAVTHTGGVAVGNLSTQGVVTFNRGQGLIKADVVDIGTLTTSFAINGPSADPTKGFQLSSQYGALSATFGAGAFDADADGKLSASEYGHTGDITVTSLGGAQTLTFASTRFVSSTEQSLIGKVTAINSTYAVVNAGAIDTLGAGQTPLGSAFSGARGDISLIGALSQVGGIGDLSATTTAGVIRQVGLFGDVGAVTLKTSSYVDTDTNPALSNEPPVVLASGSIVLGASGYQPIAKGGDVDPGADNPFTPDVVENFLAHAPLEITGRHGLATYEVKETGSISGSIYYGGAATGTDSLNASAERGNISLALWLEDVDRDASGAIEAGEWATFGKSTVRTTAGGDILLALGTDQNLASTVARNLIPELNFGALTVSATEGYATTSDTALDSLNDAGLAHVTITGLGADSTTGTSPYGNVTGNRGNIESLTASVTRGTLTLNGHFGSLGDQSLSAGRYLDVQSSARTDVYAGLINYSPSIWGSHGTATLRSDDTGAGGSGSRILSGDGAASFDPLTADSNFATLVGTAVFGGLLQSGRTVGIDAKTGRTDIDLDILARGYDRNGDGKIFGTEDAKTAADVEFAQVGDVLVETTRGGDVDLGLGSSSAGTSKSGASIGKVTVTANDDVVLATDNANDQIVDLATVRISGLSTVFTGGEIGDLTATLGAGQLQLTGTYARLGKLTLTTAQYVDLSAAGGVSAVLASGNILLGTGKSGTHANADLTGGTTLNLAQGFQGGSVTVLGAATITGEIFATGAGSTTDTLTLKTDQGIIDVGLVAGFDLDNADGDNNTGTGADDGNLGNVSATSTSGSITLGLAARSAGSQLGLISAQTGDVVAVQAAALDTLTSGQINLTSLAGGSPVLGNIVGLKGVASTGTISLNGTFGGVGSIDFSTGAYVDNDTTAGTGEEPVLIKAGDIVANGSIWGQHGAYVFRTVDSSVLPSGKSTLPGTVNDLGNITATLAFSGPSTSGGVSARSDRGNITMQLTAGIDEDGAADFDATDAGAIGNITAQSIDGDLSLLLNVRNSSSSVGAIALTTGATWQALAAAVDTEIATGDIEIKSNNLGANAQNYGSVGSITAATLGGGINLSGAFENLGAVTLTTGTYVDDDSAVGSTELPVVLSSNKGITVNATVRGQHDTFTLTTHDNALIGGPASHPAPINVDLTFYGSLASGSTKSLVATAEQGAISGQVKAGVYLTLADAAAGVANDDVTTNADDHVGKTGAVDLSSLYNDIDLTFTTTAPVAVVGANDLVRVPSIGDIKANAGSSYFSVAAAPDTLISKGDVLLTNNSLGSIGSITATTTSGDIQLDGSASNLIGAISLTTGQYIDSDTLGVIAGGAGSIVHSTDYRAQLAVAAVPGASPATLATGVTGSTITLTTTGSLTGTHLSAGKITDSGDWMSRWVDDGDNLIEPGELLTVSFGKISMAATDGEILFQRQATGLLNSRSYGVTLANVSLVTTGNATTGSSGNITLSGGGFFSEISQIDAQTTEGDIIWSGNYEAPTVTDVKLRATSGDAILSGALNLGLVNAINSRTTSAAMTGILLQAVDGNVILSGNLGEAIDYRTGFIAPASGVTTDNRTASITSVSLQATNGASNDGVNDGVITVSGRIGGGDISWMDGVTLSTPTLSGDKTVLTNSIGGLANLEAWNMGTLIFQGTTYLTNNGLTPNIRADDAATTRSLNGSVVYLNPTTFLPVNSTVSTPGYGSVLNSIGKISVTGTLIGTNSVTLRNSSLAEIMASRIGDLEITTAADPTASTLYSVVDLDVLAAPQTGEFIAENAAAKTLTGYQTIDAFSIGNVVVQHNLQGTSVGTAIFSGNSAIVAGGAMGNLTLISNNQGGVQAPLFLPSANGSAWFVVGDINGKLGTVNTEIAYGQKTTNGTALVPLPTAKLVIGDVTINAGSSYTPPSAQNSDIGNAGGGTGGGLAVAVGVDVNTAGNYFGTGASPATAINSTGTRVLYGSMGAVSVSNDAIRPDNDTLGAAPTGSATAPGVIVVAGDGTTAPEIADIVNELLPAGIIRMSDGQYYTVGDVDGNGDATGNDVVVYVV